MGEKIKIFYQGKYKERDIDSFIEKIQPNEVVDLVENQFVELAKVKNPSKPKLIQTKGDWIYFPWSKTLIHNVSERDYFTIRTNRNREIITIPEQKKLYQSCVAIFGMSIGGNMAASLSYQGIAQQMKLADFDTLETSNLNRLQSRLSDVGKKKIDIVARRIYEINPYQKLYLFSKGINDKNLDKFYSRPRPNVVIDAIDDLKMKIKLRLRARDLKIPVLMVTNLGDRVLIDVERFDLNNKLPLFHGLIGKTPEDILKKKKINSEDEQKLVVGLVGIENIPPKTLESVKLVGKTLVGRPQLMSTVTTSTGIATLLVRKLLLGEKLISGRKLIKFDELLNY